MHRFAFPTPVLPGHDARELLAVFDGRDDDYVASRQRLGIQVERLYTVAGPRGTTLVTYLETDWDYGTTLRGEAISDRQVDSDFRDRFWQVHGIEIEQLAARPAPQLIGEWLDPAITKRRNGLGFSFDLNPGVAAEARQFGDDAFRHRRYEHTLSRRLLPLTVERVYLAGDTLTFYIEADDPAAGYAQLAASQSVHDVWFKQRCRELLAGGAGLDEPLPAIDTIWDRDLAAVLA